MMTTSKRTLNSQVWKTECLHETLSTVTELGPRGPTPALSTVVACAENWRHRGDGEPSVTLANSLVAGCVCNNQNGRWVTENMPLLNWGPWVYTTTQGQEEALH